MTSAPTGFPTVIPSELPTSTIPSAEPTITGAVIFIEMNTVVQTSLTEEEVAVIVSNAEDSFDVFPGTVEAEVTYEISGTISMGSVDSNLSDEEIINALQNAIADSLSIHSSDVIVSIDPESGDAMYTISSANAEDAIALQEMLVEESTNEFIAAAIPDLTDVTEHCLSCIVRL